MTLLETLAWQIVEQSSNLFLPDNLRLDIQALDVELTELRRLRTVFAADVQRLADSDDEDRVTPEFPIISVADGGVWITVDLWLPTNTDPNPQPPQDDE